MESTQIKKNADELERRLKSLRDDPKQNHEEIREVEKLLQAEYRRLILEHTAFACVKDIDGQLWKYIFYRNIEDYRRVIKKSSEHLDKCQKKASDATDPDLVASALKDVEKLRTHLARLHSAFATFLSDAALFYQELMRALEDKHRAANNDDSPRCIHRCLLYLGDIARYAELYSDRKANEKNYTNAENYYMRASFWIPTSGNPHNQLAVLATYKDTECVAVYHYCRSMMVALPFAACADNLTILFEKNARICAQLRADAEHQQLLLTAGLSLSTQLHEYLAAVEPASAPTSDTQPWYAQRKNKKSVAIKLKNFLMNFVRFHGELFAWTRHTVKGAQEGKEGNGHRASGSDSLDIAKLALLSQGVLDDFDLLLSASAFSERIVVRLLVICLFSIHHGATLTEPAATAVTTVTTVVAESSPSPVPLKTKDPPGPASRSTSESVALSFLFRLVAKAARRLELVSRQADKLNRYTVAVRILPMLSVFAEWGWEHRKYLVVRHESSQSVTMDVTDGVVESVSVPVSVPEPAALIGGAGGGASGGASGDALRAENDSRLLLKTALVALQEIVEASIRSIPVAAGRASAKLPRVSDAKVLFVEAKGRPLWEHMELRGFSPLAARYEIYFAGIDPASRPPPSIPDEAARDRRLRTLRLLIREWPTTAVGEDGKAGVGRPRGERSGAGMFKVSAALMNAATGGRGRDKEKDKDREKDKDKEKRKMARRERQKDERRERREMRDRGRARTSEGRKDPNKQLYDPNADLPPLPSRRDRPAGATVVTSGVWPSIRSDSKSTPLTSPNGRDGRSGPPGPAPMNYAASLMHTSTAPTTTVDPFEGEYSDMSDEEYDEDEEEEEEGEEGEGEEGSRDTGDGWDAAGSGAVAMSAFSGLFGASNRLEPLVELPVPANYSQMPMDVATPAYSLGGEGADAVGAAMAVLDEEDDDDDFADDVVVFRPAFARPEVAPSPSFSSPPAAVPEAGAGAGDAGQSSSSIAALASALGYGGSTSNVSAMSAMSAAEASEVGSFWSRPAPSPAVAVPTYDFDELESFLEGSAPRSQKPLTTGPPARGPPPGLGRGPPAPGGGPPGLAFGLGKPPVAPPPGFGRGGAAVTATASAAAPAPASAGAANQGLWTANPFFFPNG